MSGGPSGDVSQSIELFNYETGSFELMELRAATTIDESVEVIATGDPSRFVQPGTNEITARVTWKSDSFSGKPFFWMIDVDQAVWMVLD